MSCARCENLEEQVAWLKAELGLSVDATATADLERAFGITSGPAKLLLAMHRAAPRVLTPWLLAEALPGGPNRDIKIIDVYVHRLRKVLGKAAIETVRTRGYRLSESGMAKVAAILSPSQVGQDSLLDHCIEPEKTVVPFAGEGRDV